MYGGIKRYHGFKKPEAHAAQDPFETMEIPTEPPIADPRTVEQRRGDAQKLSKLCSDAGLKTVERIQYFITLDTEGQSGMVHLCREYTLPRKDLRFRARGWIRENTKIGPVLNVHVCHHEDRYSIEFQVRSLFQDRTASRVRIVNGIEIYVNETTETMEDEEHEALGKPIAKARNRMKSTLTLAPVSVPLRGRKWVDVNPGSYDHECFVVSKAMIRLLRHDQNVPRETDGAVKKEDAVEEFNRRKRKNFEDASMQCHSTFGFLFWQKEEEPRKSFNIA